MVCDDEETEKDDYGVVGTGRVLYWRVLAGIVALKCGGKGVQGEQRGGRGIIGGGGCEINWK